MEDVLHLVLLFLTEKFIMQIIPGQHPLKGVLNI